MSENFRNGGSHLESGYALEEFTLKNNTVGYPPDSHDPNGSCYWADKDNMDPIWHHHDSNIAEHELGFNDGTLKNQTRYRVDCDDLSAHNQRIATGYEQGVNDNFTGIVIDENGNKTISPDAYNERTSGGQPECVSDQIPLDKCSVSGPRTFDDPNDLAKYLSTVANEIQNAPDSPDKRAALSDWNTEADALKTRISGEQDYLQGRINDHEKRMSEFPEGSLEYNRANENRRWCQKYSNDLAASKDKLQAKQDELNNFSQHSNTSSKNAANGNTIDNTSPVTAADTSNNTNRPLETNPRGEVDTNKNSNFYNAKIAPTDDKTTASPNKDKPNDGFKM